MQSRCGGTAAVALESPEKPVWLQPNPHFNQRKAQSYSNFDFIYNEVNAHLCLALNQVKRWDRTANNVKV